VTVAYDYPTPVALAERLLAERAAAPVFEEELPASGPVDEPIAIVGIGCRSQVVCTRRTTCGGC